ncbi:MAG: EF-hand domain-containing protein [Caulobacteraceae bacterium]
MRLDRRAMGGLLAAAATVGVLPRLAFADAVPPGGGVWPNVFISPAGKPFRAKADAPYPVVVWFREADANGDGKLDKAEFLADCDRFFTGLDPNKTNVLGPLQIAIYEQRIAPEVLGGRVDLRGSAGGRPLLWLAQVDRPGPIDPGGPDTDAPTRYPHSLDESGQGAAPYSFFDEPEPLMAADLNFRGVVSRADFLKLAEAHFATLDDRDQGYLTLDGLPKTPVQKALEKGRRGRRKG